MLHADHLPLVIAIPYAGGDCYAYRQFDQSLKGKVKFKVIEPAGRGLRRKEPLPEIIEEMASDVYQTLLQMGHSEPYVLYGHSMGALVGFELCHLIENSRFGVSGPALKMPYACFFTGRHAPSVHRDLNFSNLPSHELWQQLLHHGGISAALLEQKELLAYFEPVIRSDFKALEKYKYKPRSIKLSPKLTVWWGRKEWMDIDHMKPWQDEFLQVMELDSIDGHHFFIFQNPELITNKLIQMAASANG